MWIALTLTVAVASGCGEPGQVKVYPVKRKITFDGKAMVGGGAISFVPTAGQSGKTAGGEIKSDGTYELRTYKDGDGSMTGEFRVVISQVVAKEPPKTNDGEAPAAATSAVSEADHIPAIYSDHQNSPLTTKVEPKPANVIDFDLQRSAGPPPQTGAG